MHTDMDGSFKERLKFVLDGRAPYPWGASIGLARGQIDSIFRQGFVPKFETMIPISRAEHVSIPWLLEGTGDPYYTSRFSEDAECADYLKALLDEVFDIYLVVDSRRFLLVLANQWHYLIDERDVEYTQIHALCGRCGTKTLEALKSGAPPSSLYLVEVESGILGEITRGRMGTWKLLGAGTAVLNKTTPIDSSHPVFDWPEDMPGLSAQEVRLIQIFRNIPETKKKALLALLG